MSIRSIIINRFDTPNHRHTGTYSLLIDGGTGSGQVAKVGLTSVREAVRYTADLIEVMESGGELPMLVDSPALTRKPAGSQDGRAGQGQGQGQEERKEKRR